MPFPAKHYVPALKLKGGEKSALAELKPIIKRNLTPLLQVVEKKDDKSLDEHIKTAFMRIEPAVEGLQRYFLDPLELTELGGAAAHRVFSKADGLLVPFTPVVGPSRPTEVTLAALEARGRTGLAVRVTRSEFETGWLERNFRGFLASHSLAPSAIDLIIDLGSVDDMIPVGIASLTEALISTLPDLGEWSTVTLLASAFPKSMRHVTRDNHDFVERSEWLAWRDHLRSATAANPRPPTFGDWAIQHPAGVEGFDFKTMQGSAAIRYALESQWLLIKGRGTRKAKPSLQMPGLAAQLVSGPLRKNFRGAAHCAGCEMIVAAADGASGFGSLPKWRQIGTVHHLTTVVEALQQRPSP